MRAYGNRRDANEPPIVEGLRDVGASVEHLNAKGVPDLLVGYRGRNWLLEIKDPSRKPSERRLTEDQQVWHMLWQGQAVKIETLDEALAAIGAKETA